jgi:dipeptidase E
MFLKSDLVRLYCLGSEYNNKSTLFLSGGGSENITEVVDRFFLENILPKKEKIKILYIPIAKSGDMNVYKKSLKWLKNKFLKINPQNNLEFILCTKLENVIYLSDYDAVYIGGGNTYRLLYLFNKTNFKERLIQYIRLGGIVYGASAGVVLLGSKISTFIEDKYLPENIKHKYTAEQGLSIFNNFSFLTHFEDGDEIKVSDFFKKGYKDDVLCIPPGTAFVLNKNSSYVVGLKSVYLYKSNGVISKFN